jgi:hypothetical protein
MRKQRQFRPAVEDARLEDRVVLSHSHIAAAHAHVVAADPPHAKLPVATESEVKATLHGIHSALVSFSNSMTAFFNNVMAQLNAGTINQQGAQDLLSGYGFDIKFNQLFYNIQTAARHVPYGAGFNGFATSNPNTLSGLGVAPLPSGDPDLVTLLTSGTAQNGFVSPIGTIERSFDNALFATPPDFNAVGQAVSHSAIVTAYQESVPIVQQYIVDGVTAGDFRFKG